MFLKGFLLQAQFPGCSPVPQTDSMGARAALVMPLSARHIPTKSGFLLCQGKILFVNIIFYWELVGPLRVFLFFLARKKGSVRSITLLYYEEASVPLLLGLGIGQ